MINLRLLGAVELHDDGGSDFTELLKHPRQLSVLVYLAAQTTRSHHRQQLLALLWEELPQEQAHDALEEALVAIRQTLGGDAVLVKGDGEMAVNYAGVAVDVRAFEDAIGAADHQRAVDWYRGEFVDGFYSGAAAFERWADQQRTRLRQHAITAAFALAEHHEKAGNYLGSVECARWAIGVAPADETVFRRVLALLDQHGDRVTALREYESFTRRLADDFGLAPTPETEAAVERIRARKTPVPVGADLADAPRTTAAGPRQPGPSAGLIDRKRLAVHLARVVAHRYTIEREVGAGGMAVVFLAHDVKHDRKVAIKVLRPELTESIGVERFLNEVRIEAALEHPNIVPLYDSGDAEGLPYYVMPYFEGESLRRRLQQEPQLQIDEAVRIARDIADALDEAHRHGIVHRDIKPENILFRQGRALVSDFGVARALTEAGAMKYTATGVAVGTPGYMSPEQATGDHQLDGRSDQYSLACITYEMLAGEMLFTGPSARAIIAKHVSLAPTPVRMLRPRVPEGMEQALLVALDKSAVDRFATAGEFATALEEGLQGEPDRSILGLPKPGARSSAPSISDLIATVSGYLLGALLVFTMVGLWTTLAYDVKMDLPAGYSPSREDFPIVGVRAAIPALLFGSALVLSYLVLKYVLRLPIFLLRRVFRLGPTLDGLVRRSTGSWRKLWRPVQPATIAELFFVVVLALSFLALLPYRRLLASLWTDDTEILACAFRPLHGSYTFVMILLITLVSLSWVGMSRYLRVRRARGVGVTAARWGSAAWLVILVMMMTMPWRLLWQNDRPRALLDGERVYILVERESELVVYNADRDSTRQYPKSDALNLDRLNTTGYVFESAEEFDSDAGC